MKKIISILLSVLLVAALAIVSAGAASYLLGDADLNGTVDVVDATLIQRYEANMITLSDIALKAADVDRDGEATVIDAAWIQRYELKMKAPQGIGVDEVYDYEYSLNAKLMDGVPGVYEVKATVGDRMDGDSPKTIGIPDIAKQNLTDGSTTEAPAIIMGSANGFETKTGPVEWTMNEGLTEDDIVAPYRYFRHRVIDEKITDADGNVSIHKKASGFDGTYYIIRVDVSDLIDGRTGYLHVKQESNKAIIAMAGMQGGISTGISGRNEDGTQKTNTPVIDETTGHWFIDGKDTGIAADVNNTSLSYVDVDGNWCVYGAGFGDGLGGNTRAFSIADNGAALKDTTGKYQTKPYVDIIVNSSGKLSAGADTGSSTAPSADIKLSMYVDNTWDYNPELSYDPTSTDVDHAKKIMAKFYKDEAFTAENNAASYIVKGSDMEIDVDTRNLKDGYYVDEYWSLEKAMANPEYNTHTIKLICEVPVLEGLTIGGTENNYRLVTLDVNSFDIQIANHSTTGAAGLTVKNYATLRLTDESRTSGAELAVGNNASMEVETGGTLIIDESCQLEVEYDAATQTQGGGEQTPSTPDLTNGVITVHSGGKIINNGVINIEGLEVKPLQPSQQEQEQQQSTKTDMKASNILIEAGGSLDNYGCISLKGNLYVLGTINNYGKYDDVISAQDPDKGTINYHKGIQLSWKDDVTVLDEATQKYKVNSDVVPGTLFIGSDAEGNKNTNAEFNNYGDIVLVPGILNIDGKFSNLANGEVLYAGHLYVCDVTEAVVPINPDPKDPTKTEERRELAEPYPSVVNKGESAAVTNNGVIAKAEVKILSNGILGELTQKENIDI
ncbi:dockerin type I repeat-containing protein [Ruminococcus sp.]|uniref:dockerin type I repeat-containing protein n=1 Tax=Ruminococcus sp. TaxID=41978 RepID=UPI003890B515